MLGILPAPSATHRQLCREKGVCGTVPTLDVMRLFWDEVSPSLKLHIP